LECKLLIHFIEHPQVSYSIDELKLAVWKQQYLSDSAVKKAISELRKAVRQITDEEVIVTRSGQGYQLSPKWNHNKHPLNTKLVAVVSLIVVMLIFGIIYGRFDSTKQTDLNNSSLTKNVSDDAYALYLKGKVAYYEQGNTDLALEFFEQSLAMQQQANPSSAALLDIYGLQARSLLAKNRVGAINERLLAQVARVEVNGYRADNAIALSKYALVNLGDIALAKSYLEQIKGDIFAAHDLHIPAYVYALSGETEKSIELINFAETRHPNSGTVAWYKGLILFVSGQIEETATQAEWAQKSSPDWYPLVYAAPLLKQNRNVDTLAYFKAFKPQMLEQYINGVSTLNELLMLVCAELSTQIVEPFETEILYMLAVRLGKMKQQQQILEYIKNNYPEKLMLLPFIERWFQE
jgi:tetratricopeptide (TPR) repeat protein